MNHAKETSDTSFERSLPILHDAGRLAWLYHQTVQWGYEICHIAMRYPVLDIYK